ncbi:MAG TPA: GNAT family N-acetyltransferase [Thermoanaerobaculia bacterium]|nr:GNAT family N-acetyltransferase [Thermoanaerobaculia bacterium]
MNETPLLGILAGMGPRSTGPFLDLVITECQLQHGARHDADFPKMMICSQPVPFYEDRPNDNAAIFAATRDGLVHLERTGADLLAIACNTAHIFYPGLARSVRAPLLNMVELAVAAIPETARQVALLAARPTVEAGIYQARIEARGLAVAAIDWQDDVDHLLGATREATTAEESARHWTGLMGKAEATGADTVLVACLDLSGILAHARTDLTVVDAARSLARELVAEWGRRRGPDPVPAAGQTRRFTISTDPARQDVDAVHAYLTRSYWAQGVPREVVAESMRHSLCFGLFDPDGAQVGFARVVTDRATFAYLCDVYVLEEHRGGGLGKWLVGTVVEHPDLRKVRRFLLATRDAHTLYEQYGFTPMQAPERFMEIFRPRIYAEGN